DLGEGPPDERRRGDAGDIRSGVTSLMLNAGRTSTDAGCSWCPRVCHLIGLEVRGPTWHIRAANCFDAAAPLRALGFPGAKAWTFGQVGTGFAQLKDQ